MRIFKIWTILLLTLVTLLLPWSLAESIEENTAAASQIEVQSLVIDPAVLMPHDVGVVTVVLKNTGTVAVPISHAILYDKTLIMLSDNYGKVGSIGAGNTMTLEFTIQARALTGIFYPILSLDFRGAHFLRYPFRVQVQEQELDISVLSRPEVFVEGKRDIIRLHIGNPRDNNVSGVTITPGLSSHEITPTSYFVGTIDPDEFVDIPFNITAYGNETLIFNVTYQNGINAHSVSYSIPVKTGKSRRQANPVLSNVVISSEGNGQYRVSGDVTNSGLETANAVEVSAGPPAEPVFPYKVFAVGIQKPDDFASFEVTFKANGSSLIPLITSYKDGDGNEFSSNTTIDLASSSVQQPVTPAPPPEPDRMMYIIPGGVALVVLIAIWTSRRRP
ncbi:MAG TPA: hypothetical protein VN372_12825 [Methanospirillum sp.]|nr:hypothetical protein [Methanospirillum sp.]